MQILTLKKMKPEQAYFAYDRIRVLIKEPGNENPRLSYPLARHSDHRGPSRGGLRMTHVITLEDLLAFARTKSGVYRYSSNENCAMAQYCREKLGFSEPNAGPFQIGDYMSDRQARYAFRDNELFYTGNEHDPEFENWEALTTRLEARALRESVR